MPLPLALVRRCVGEPGGQSGKGFSLSCWSVPTYRNLAASFLMLTVRLLMGFPRLWRLATMGRSKIYVSSSRGWVDCVNWRSRIWPFSRVVCLRFRLVWMDCLIWLAVLFMNGIKGRRGLSEIVVRMLLEWSSRFSCVVSTVLWDRKQPSTYYNQVKMEVMIFHNKNKANCMILVFTLGFLSPWFSIGKLLTTLHPWGSSWFFDQVRNS